MYDFLFLFFINSLSLSSALPLVLALRTRSFAFVCVLFIYICTFLLCIYTVITKFLSTRSVLMSMPEVVAWPQGATSSVSTKLAVLLWADSVCNYNFGVAISALRVKHLEISQKAKCEDQLSGLLILHAFVCHSIRINVHTVKRL